MLTIRFSTGVAVQYPSATYWQFYDTSVQLYTADPKGGGRVVATIQNNAGVIIEAAPAARVWDDTRAAASLVDQLRRELRDLPPSARESLVRLKRELQDFDATRKEWKS